MMGARPRDAARKISFDRLSGQLRQADARERLVAFALKSGSMLSRPFGYRGYSLGCRALAGLAGQSEIVVGLGEQALFSFPLADGYWSRLLDPGFRYEEELDIFFRRVKDVDYALLDCGANFGYWSVLASSPAYGAQKSIAIEASPDNAAWLARNATLNGRRFQTAQMAIGGSNGMLGQVQGNKHEALTIVPLRPGGDAIRMITIDRLAASYVSDTAQPLVVKLDVEGLEIESLNGAHAVLARDSIVLCEDHGSDTNHTVTRHLMNALSLEVYICDEETGQFDRVTNLQVLEKLKRFSWVGYNVFATSSPFWIDRLDRR